MSIDANPSIKEIATTFGDTPPYSMSELYGLNFSSGNAVTSGTISLSGFRNKTVETLLDETKLFLTDGDADDRFGTSVSISSDGSTALVGAWVDSGVSAAYIFEKVNGTWTRLARLTNNQSNSDFGYDVSISSDGSTALVGAYDGDTWGTAYIFEKPANGWTDTSTYAARLTTNNGSASPDFGFTVSISGDGSTAVSATRQENSDTGAVYIFEKGSSWSNMTPTAKLTASDGASGDFFGYDVSISSDGSTILVGGWGYDNPPGKAYIYEKGSGWTNTSAYTSKLVPSDQGTSSDYFGRSVSISGDGSTALVGADKINAAYIFEKGSSWSSTTAETAKLTPSYGNSWEAFGISVSISSDGSTSLIGTHVTSSPGHAFIFEKPVSGWTSTSTHTTLLTASDGVNDNKYGMATSLAGDGSTISVGARRDSFSIDGIYRYNRGSAYIYEPSYFVS